MPKEECREKNVELWSLGCNTRYNLPLMLPVCLKNRFPDFWKVRELLESTGTFGKWEDLNTEFENKR